MAQNTDFLIIGGGIAGCAAATEFSRHGKTVLLEQEQVPGYHSTGRSAALFRTLHNTPVINQLTRLSAPLLSEPPESFSDAPLMSEKGALFVGTENEAEKIDALLKARAPSDPPVQTFKTHDQITEIVPFLNPDYAKVALYDPSAREIDVAALHQSWIKAFKHQGGILAVNAMVTALTKNNQGWLVQTRENTYQTKMVINAAGAWADHIAEMGGLSPQTITPKRRTVITVDLPPEYHRQPYPMVFSLDKKFYLKTETASFIACPMDETPVAPQDVQPEEFDIATAAWLIEERTTLPVRAIKNKWAGLRSFAPDNKPVIGPDQADQSFIWLAGLGGYGIKTSPAAARAATSLAIEGRLPEDFQALNVKPDDLLPGRFAS